MAYEWGRLGERPFEQLCRALAVHAVGPGLQAFGDGPDGGREATFDGPTLLSTSTNGLWNGYGVLQAKYRRTDVGKRDVDWLHRQVTQELNAWSDPASQRVSKGRLPEYLIVATNVRLSSKPGRGGIDRIRDLLAEYAGPLGLKGWALWEANQLSMYLDAYPNVSARFSEFLTPGDVLARTIARLDELDAGPPSRSVTEKNGGPASLHGFLLHLNDGRPPRASDLDALDLGVKPAIGTRNNGADLPQYVARTCDPDLDRALSQGGMVLLHGRAAAGKSRSALEAVQRVLPQHEVLVPAGPGSLRRLLDAGFKVRDAVVWLDDLEQYLVPAGVDLATVQQLCPQGRSDVVVVATIRDEVLARIEQSGAISRAAASSSAVTIAIEAAGRELLRYVRGWRRVPVSDHLTAAERDTIGSDNPDQRLIDALAADVGFGEYLDE
ncbi:hypothetical protein [Actinoplanes sp. NPDC020271]|uniref:hypothetical protein n=1 Tax=Actinoplanes sp. NPDC020271 TaxID=3363896 RepID=UPI0037955BE7